MQGWVEDNLADTLSDFGRLLESDRMLSKEVLEESRQSIDEKDWEAENEDIAVMKLNFADLRQEFHVQHADRSYSERDGTIDFKITGTDTVLFFSQDTAYIISNAGKR